VVTKSGPDARPGANAKPEFSLALFEQLNEEYRDHRLVTRPPRRDTDGRMDAARRRLAGLGRDVELEGRRVLEIGAAHGHLASLLVLEGGAASAVGVDIVESDEWERFQGPGVSFVKADLAREDVFEPGSVDLVVSNAVLEHVDRPLAMLAAIWRLLADGGEAWLIFNLYRGPKASHRYREIFFPWPHLLFEDSVVEEYYREHHGRSGSFAWVNKLTAAEYLTAFGELGFEIAGHRLTKTPIDLRFYARFEEKLGRYPALDLEMDFLWLKLRKSGSQAASVPDLGYTDRQIELYRQLDALRAGLPVPPPAERQRPQAGRGGGAEKALADLRRQHELLLNARAVRAARAVRSAQARLSALLSRSQG